MNILITGGTGFIGKHLIKRLSKSSDNISALARKTSSLVELKKYDIKIIYGDLLDITSLENATKGMDLVYHCAAYVKDSPLNKLLKINVEGTKNICNVSLKSGVKN